MDNMLNISDAQAYMDNLLERCHNQKFLDQANTSSDSGDDIPNETLESNFKSE